MISWNLTSCFFFFCVAPLGFVESGGDADSDVALSRMASYVTKGVSFWLVIGLHLPVASDSLAQDVCNPSVGLAPSGKFAVII